jgi:hypothetical protein
MKNYINFVLFVMSHHKQLFLATALVLGCLGDAPPGGF